MGLAYQISNFFINKTSQRKKKFFWKKISICHNFLHVLTILWAFCLVTSPKNFQIWDLLYLSFHLTPCMLSLTKIENWPNIWKWNAKAIKHKCARFRQPWTPMRIWKARVVINYVSSWRGLTFKKASLLIKTCNNFLQQRLL